MVAFGNILIVFIFGLDYTYSVSRPQITDLGDLNFLASWEPVENYTGMYNLTALFRKRKNLCYTNATSCFLGGKLLEDEDCPFIKGMAITLEAGGTEPRRNYILNNIFRVGPPNVQSLKIESTNATIEVQGGRTPLYFDAVEEKFRGASWTGEKSPIFMGQWETRRVSCKYNLTNSSGLNASHEVKYFFGELSNSDGKLHIILEKLKPFSSYSISVWCNLNRHDSRITVYNFTTKEDVPSGGPTVENLSSEGLGCDKPDLRNITFTIRPPPEEQRHGILQFYEIRYRVITSNKDERWQTEIVDLPSPPPAFTEVLLDDLFRWGAYEVKVFANNSVGGMSSSDHLFEVHESLPPTIQNTAYNTTANESKKASLTCVVIGNPSPQVSWERLGNHSANLWDRTLVVTTEENSDYECVVKSTLNIMDVQPDIDLGNYKCTAKSSAGKDEAVITLSGAYPPTTPRIAISKPSSIVAEGTEDLEILCDLVEGWPRPELVWIFPNNPSLSLDQVTLSNGSQLLIFSGVNRANAGMYRCVANNSAPLTSSADHQLVVEFPSTIHNKDDNTEHALEGENVIFICEAEGKPIPTITWLQLRNQSAELDNGILVTQSEQRAVYRSLVTSTLIIAEVKPEMYNTTFSCVANNNYGTDRKDFHLKKPDPESQKKLGPAMISVAFIMLTVILLILIFVIIRWWISRKNKHGQEQSKSQRSKNVHNSDPSSSIDEDKPYDELSNTGMETRKLDIMPLHETPMELADRSPPNKEDEPLIY